MNGLRALARRMGILAEYVDQSGTERRLTSDATRVALLAAMGVDASNERACRTALAELDAERNARPIDPVAVSPVGASTLDVRADTVRHWTVTIREEGQAPRAWSGVGRPGRIALGPLPAGYHEVELALDGHAPFTQRRIVAPPRCPSVRDRTGRDRTFGIAAQLYAVRSACNWGIGDLRDLTALVRRAGTWGAAFVGLNPLHALTNEGDGVSPYSPVSRLFRNWLYLDVEAVPEFDGAAPAELPALRRAARVAYDEVARTKRAALEGLFASFRARPNRDPRREGFEAYVRFEGADLMNFATYSAMSDADRRRIRDPRGPEAVSFREAHRDAVDFEAWLQFELDRQLGGVARVAREAGLTVGIYQDLAIGCAPDGSDVWANPELFASGVAIGAPPDSYSRTGQNWGLPPINPHRLKKDGYRYWSTLLRHALEHAGALRIDHAVGMFQQFWIPAGKGGQDGAYVEFPAEDLLGILALEASRAGAIVVGEDLGTVPAHVPEKLAAYGVLSSRVLYFEIDRGAFNAASTYPVNALTTANTHDMAPLVGWWDARDAELKERAGIIDEATAGQARARRGEERRALIARLRGDGLLHEAPQSCDPPTVAAVHAFLARTPSSLVGISLDDVVGEAEPVNVPGTSLGRHPNWQRKYSVALEDLADAPPTLPDTLRDR